MTIIVLHNQSLADVALQYCGTMESIFTIALLNGISVTATLEPGQEIHIPNIDYGYKEVINYYKNKKIEPATNVTAEQETVTVTPGGIGEMIIQNTFIIY